jgi:ferredoxin-nitrite reductase
LRNRAVGRKVQDNEEADPVGVITCWSAGLPGLMPHSGRELYRDVKADDILQTIERVLKAYLANRASPQESFIEFARRHDIDVLKAFAAEAA